MACQQDDPSGIAPVTETNFKTVSPERAVDFLDHFKKSKKSMDYVVSIGDTVFLENISNSTEQLAVLPATTIYKNLNSRIVLLEINGTVNSVVFSTNAYEGTTANTFSGEILITDLKGNFINGYEMIKNKLVLQYVKTSGRARAYLKNSDSEECLGCPFQECIYCTMDEVIVIGSPNRQNTYIALNNLFDHLESDSDCEELDGCIEEDWDFGGGGSSAPPTTKPCAEGFTRNELGDCVPDEECDLVGDTNGDCIVDEEEEALLQADCSSWEYAMSNGVRGAAVTGITDSWVTWNNGELRYDKVFTKTLYFSMPLGMTNGRAATLSAQAVDEVGGKIDDWLSINPGSSPLQISIKFYELLQEQMKSYGGSVSKNNLYGILNDPTTFKRTLLTQKNCG
ncbi:MAG: hypothetical protein WBG71_08055 [Leeuwenhoekiella sp.]